VESRLRRPRLAPGPRRAAQAAAARRSAPEPPRPRVRGELSRGAGPHQAVLEPRRRGHQPAGRH
jgi:hypothetical protein